MKHLKKAYILAMLLTLIIGSRTSAQDFLEALMPMRPEGITRDRAKEVMRDNEYVKTGYEQGNFFCNPLLLNGKPLDYNNFSVESKGKLTVIKGAAITGETTQVPFYVYLRRNGNNVLIPSKVRFDLKQIDISEILRYAKPGDQLVIEAVKKEDGPVKRVLKLLGGGC